MEKEIKSHYYHVDNGGIYTSIVDKGVKEGIVFRIVAQYFGYPGISSEVRIDNIKAKEWLRDVGLMFLSASEEVSKIDFKGRYENG